MLACVLYHCCSTFKVHLSHLHILLKCSSGLVNLKCSLKVCISNEFPGNNCCCHSWHHTLRNQLSIAHFGIRYVRSRFFPILRNMLVWGHHLNVYVFNLIQCFMLTFNFMQHPIQFFLLQFPTFALWILSPL